MTHFWASSGHLLLDREPGGVRTCREHQPVVVDALAAVGDDLGAVALDPRDGDAAQEPHPLVRERTPVEGEVVGRRPGEEGREADPVVGMPLLLTDHGDPPRLVGAAEQALDEAVRDHPGTDHDHVGRGGAGGAHVVTVCGRGCLRGHVVLQSLYDAGHVGHRVGTAEPAATARAAAASRRDGRTRRGAAGRPYVRYSGMPTKSSPPTRLPSTVGISFQIR